MNDFDRCSIDAADVVNREMGEDAVVVFADGSTRSVRVVVDRSPPARVLSNQDLFAPEMMVEIPNRSDGGIDARELDAGGSTRIRLSRVPGGPIEELGLYRPPPGVTWCDAGSLLLHVM